MNIIKDIETEQISEILKKREVPVFKSGDTVKVNVFVTEGNKERVQAFEGICIARSNRGFNSTFTIRKISHGEGVERVFSLFSPIVEKIEVIRKGDVRRAKLYYLRELSGKKARIADKDRGEEADQYEFIEEDQPIEQTKPEESESKPAEEVKPEEVQAVEESKAEEAEAKPTEEAKAEAAEDQKEQKKIAAEDNSDDKK